MPTSIEDSYYTLHLFFTKTPTYKYINSPGCRSQSSGYVSTEHIAVKIALESNTYYSYLRP